jgi:hypothetical protein
VAGVPDLPGCGAPLERAGAGGLRQRQGPGRGRDQGCRGGGQRDGGRGEQDVPDQVKSLQAALAATKEKFAKGDHTAALGDAKSLTDKAKEVASAASAKKAELTSAWEGLSAGMPKVLDAIKGRVDILSKSKKLPANLTAEKFASAKSGLEEMTQQWTAATESANGGNLMDAMTKGTAVKTKAAEVLTTLGMPVPDALKT